MPSLKSSPLEEEEEEDMEHIRVMFKPDFRVYTIVNGDRSKLQVAAMTS